MAMAGWGLGQATGKAPGKLQQDAGAHGQPEKPQLSSGKLQECVGGGEGTSRAWVTMAGHGLGWPARKVLAKLRQAAGVRRWWGRHQPSLGGYGSLRIEVGGQEGTS